MSKIQTNIPYKVAKGRETNFLKVCILLVQFKKGYVSMGHLKLYLNIEVFNNNKCNNNLSAEQ